MSKSKKRKKGLSFEDRPIEQPCAAGIDIGAREIFVAVHHDVEARPVRRFGTFTEDLEQMADWLSRCGVTTVAMESTGVYWIPLFEILDRRGLKPCVVNARHMKNVPGRRTDWHECQWIQFLHSVGLLRAAFRPEDQVCVVRAIVRHRQQLVEMAAQHVQHMHKSLTQMNLQIHHVISDITGATGLAILDAILAGERDPAELAKLRDPRIKATAETVAKSLRGNWREEHLFTLRQSLELYRFYAHQIATADRKTESLLSQFAPRVDPQQKPLPADGKKNRRHARRRGKADLSPGFDLRTEGYKLFGVDVTQIPGLAGNILPLFSEVGRDLSRWPDADHFVSWLALCPDNDISGGRVLWRGMRTANNRTGQIFRMAAQSLHRSQTPMGDYLRRLKGKFGPAGATTAAARKIATLFYTLVSRQVEYDPSVWAKLDQGREKRLEAKLHRQAAQRGYKLVPLKTAA
ncbi:MAG TPA: IS110 family transposase [Bryobacteraceae bacterium]|jgi:transposase